MADHYLRKYASATTIDFALYKLDGAGLKIDAASATGDIKIMKDEGNEANTTADAFVDEGQGYSLALTATEMTAARVVIYIVDLSSPQVWLDKQLIIETYGNASAQIPNQDVNVASIDNIDFGATMKTSLETAVDNGLDNAVPAVNTAGSVNDLLKDQIDVVVDNIHDTDLPAVQTEVNKIGTITNTGGTATIGAVLGDVANSAVAVRLTTIDDFLDTEIAAILADTNELQTDWVNGGRLDLLLDSTITKIDAVDDFVDTEVAAIKAITDTLTLTAIADAVHDEVTEGTTTLRQAVKLISSALLGKSSGGGTATGIYRDIGDTKPRITATMDVDGNRTAMTLDGA